MNTPVNIKLAKLLKEKRLEYQYEWNPSFDNLPTIAEVVMSLYEKHEIFVTVNIPHEEFGKFSAEIWGKNIDDGIKILLTDGMSVFDSIEEAYEEGITEALNLIP